MRFNPEAYSFNHEILESRVIARKSQLKPNLKPKFVYNIDFSLYCDTEETMFDFLILML